MLQHLPIIEIMITKIHVNLMKDETTSISAKKETPQILIRMITTQNIVIQPAVGTSSVQKLSTVTIPYTP